MNIDEYKDKIKEKYIDAPADKIDLLLDIIDEVYHIGVDSGEETGYKKAMDDNDYSDYESEHYEQGWEEGYREGREEGEYEGRDQGENEGYERGYEVGRTDGYESGREAGQQEGYDKGYEDAMREAEQLERI